MRLHPVILAGGRGERFWPLSRRDRPKQLLPLLSDRPMLADTLTRLEGAARPADTFILTARDLVGAVRLAAPDVPHHHIVGEPVGKNTAPAVALAAWLLKDSGDDAVIAVLSSDHRLEPASRFRDELQAAGKAALARGAIVTFGVPPTRPETGYGYIEVGIPSSAAPPSTPSGRFVKSRTPRPPPGTSRWTPPLERGDVRLYAARDARGDPGARAEIARLLAPLPIA